MYAVIKTGGKQYRVQPGDLIVVEKLAGEPGDEIKLDQVLMMGDDVGAPLVAKAFASAVLVETRKGEKVKIFKKIRRQGYRRTNGHRQPESVLRVVGLTGADGKRELIERIHLALEFPADWGRNWDALADGLNDLSWLGDATPCLLVWRGIDDLHADAPELESTLIGILEDTSANWAEDGIALWSLICLARIPPAELDDADAFRH